MSVALEYDFIKNRIMNIPSLRFRALFTIQFMSAAREGEVIQIKADDIKLDGNICWITLQTLKNKRTPVGDVPFNIKQEAWAWDIIKSYLSIAKHKLFPLSTRYIRRLSNQYFGVNNHSLRHSRITWVVKTYPRMNDARLVRYARWSDNKPAVIYSHIRREDVGEVFQ